MLLFLLSFFFLCDELSKAQFSPFPIFYKTGDFARDEKNDPCLFYRRKFKRRYRLDIDGF